MTSPTCCAPATWPSSRASWTDPEASPNDRFVALDLLKNASIAAGGVLPMCQDTGTAIVFGKKGQRVWVQGNEEEALSYGVHRTYTETNLRYSQMAPLSMFEEVNTGNNLPVQFDIAAAPGEDHADEFHLMFIAKGGGSANKTFLFQETRALLASREKLLEWLGVKIRTLGTSACPPYHLAIAIGGTSAELTLKTVKLASTRYLDGLPTEGSRARPRLPRRRPGAGGASPSPRRSASARSSAASISATTSASIRLPRHGASLPVGIGVSCSADRQIKAKITPDGIFLEQLEADPARYPARGHRRRTGRRGGAGRPQPADGGRSARSSRGYPVKTRLSLTGTVVVARDIAHAKFKERLDRGEGVPDYLKRPSGVLCRPGEDARRAWRPARSAPPPPAAWTATSTCCRRPAARS